NRTEFSEDWMTETLEPVDENTRADLVETDTGFEFSRWDERLTYVFDEEGLLTTIRDDNGNEITIERDGEKVSRVVEGERFLELSWDGDLLASVADHTGREVVYTYDGGRLI